jgi:hypothetical protein
MVKLTWMSSGGLEYGVGFEFAWLGSMQDTVRVRVKMVAA